MAHAKMIAAFLVLAWSVAALGEDVPAKVVPTNPIELSTDAGSTAGAVGKVTVTERATIGKKGAVFTTEVVQNEHFVRLEVEDGDLAGLLSAIEAAIAKIDEPFSKETVGFVVKTTDFGKKRVVGIRAKGAFSDTMWFEADGATALATILKSRKTGQL